MASVEHKQLAKFIKEVHSSLRKSTNSIGANEAWHKHCQNTDVLTAYARSMETLATKYWEESYSNGTCSATSRIKWSADFTFDYFINNSYKKFMQKEIFIGSKIELKLETSICFCKPIKLLDVGSCYNPFKVYDFLNVLAIDLCPANSSVLQCDFLNVSIGPELTIEHNKLKQIKQESFEIVTFCFVLEYIPTSELRIKACEKSYNILKPGGLLIINTPDSKHVGANSKIMKCWRYTLAHLGFTRIKYEKFKHMHCMAFRKCLNKDIAVRWAHIHKEPYMECNLQIPQDSQVENEDTQNTYTSPDDLSDGFRELPFYS